MRASTFLLLLGATTAFGRVIPGVLYNPTPQADVTARSEDDIIIRSDDSTIIRSGNSA